MARIGFKPGTKTLSADSELVKGGVYAPTTLSTVDADLATGNIKNGITIFGKVGSADVFDISDATAEEAEVLDPETFYAVGGGIRTGTMPTVAITAANDDYTAGYHAGNVGGLAAIDVNLAVANIALGVNIFGFVGTLAATLAEDVTGDARSAVAGGATGATIRDRSHALDGETEEDEVSITETYNDPSLTVASVVLMVRSGADCTLRLYMDGVEMAESPTFTQWFAEILVATKAMAGVDKVCEAKVYNPTGDAVFWAPYCNSYNAKDCCYIMVGSVKV